MSAAVRPPESALIYHFTHIANLPSIAAAGRLVADLPRSTSYLVTDVGDQEVKARRRSRVIDCGPGGVAAEYVPFYFAPRSPVDDPDRLRRRMAEFLVHRELPLGLIAGYVVQTELRRRQLVEILTAAGIADAYVDVRPKWYYGYRPGR